MITRFVRKYRWLTIRGSGAIVARGVIIDGPRIFYGNLRRLTVGSGCFFSDGAKVRVSSPGGVIGELTFGRDVYLNHYAFIDCAFRVTIGDNVLIGPFAYVGDFDHMPSIDGRRTAVAGKPIVVGDGVWIGAGACILKGVTVGTGAVVGAGAVVTRDVPDGAVVVGGGGVRFLGRE